MPFSQDCLDVIGVCGNHIRHVETGQSVEECLMIQLVDPNPETGGPIDLTKYGLTDQPNSSSSSSSSSSSADDCVLPAWSTPKFEDAAHTILKNGVEFVTKQMSNSVTPEWCRMGKILSMSDAQTGQVQLTVDRHMTCKAGMFVSMALIWQQGFLKKLVPFYFEVLPNLADFNPTGPLTYYEIRLKMRDSCAEVNYLLDSLEINPFEMAAAMFWPIEYWNETLPPVTLYTPMTFPFRYHWREAVIGELMKMVGLWMHRNHLDYSAAGLTIQDSSRWQSYTSLGQQKVDDYKEWAKQKKIQMNADLMYHSVGGYRAVPYRG